VGGGGRREAIVSDRQRLSWGVCDPTHRTGSREKDEACDEVSANTDRAG
jgi:hypothetical protein